MREWTKDDHIACIESLNISLMHKCAYYKRKYLQLLAEINNPKSQRLGNGEEYDEKVCDNGASAPGRGSRSSNGNLLHRRKSDKNFN